MALTVKDIKNPEALEAFNNWKPENPADKTVDNFLATVGRKFIDSYDKIAEHDKNVENVSRIIELGGKIIKEIEDDDNAPAEIPSELTPELAKEIDELTNKLEEEYSYSNIVKDHGFVSTFALYNNLKEDFNVGEKGSLSEVAFQLAQCEARMQMFDSLGRAKGDYAKLLKDNMDDIAVELVVNQLIFDKLKIDPTALSEKNRADFKNNEKIQAEIEAFLNGKKSIALAPEVVTATMAMHYKAVSKYGDALQKQYGVPTLRQRVRSLDARLSKRYGEAWKIAKSIGSSAAAAAVFGPWGIAGLTAYRTFKKMREYNHEAKINGVGLIEHLKQHPLKIAEVSLSAGAAVFSAGVALGFEDAFFAKLGASSLRGFANESFAKNFREGKYKKTGLAFLGVSGGALVGAFLHSEYGHEFMHNVYDKGGEFINKLGILPRQESVSDVVVENPEPVQEPEPEPAPKPKVSRPAVHHPAPKPEVEPAPQPEPVPTSEPEPQYSSLDEKLSKVPEDIRPDDLAALMDGDVNNDVAHVTDGLNQGLRASRDFVVREFNDGDNGIPGVSNDEILSSMNTKGVNNEIKYGHKIYSSEQAIDEMQFGPGGDTMHPNPWGWDPQSWEVANPFVFEDPLMGYGGGYGGPYCPPVLPVVHQEVIVVYDHSNFYGNDGGNQIDHISSREAPVAAYHASTANELPQGNGESYTDGGQNEGFDQADVATDGLTSVEDVLTSNPGERVYTEMFEGENGDTFTSEVYDINGKLLETREGDISFDEHGNKVTSYLAYQQGSPEGEMPVNPDDNCLGRTTIIEDRDTGHIIGKEISDSNGEVVAVGQDFLYNSDNTLSSYAMHNMEDGSHDHHHMEYQDGVLTHENITKVSDDGQLISNEDFYYVVDKDGYGSYLHAKMDANNQVEFTDRIFDDKDGSHEFHYEKGNGSIEKVTKDDLLIWEKTINEDGNSVRTDYQYDESGKNIGRTVKTYKGNELLEVTQINGDKVQYFDGNGKMIKQIPPVDKPILDSATPKVAEEMVVQEPITNVETTEAEEIKEKVATVKEKMQGSLAGSITMGAGGAIAIGGVVAASIANQRNKNKDK